MIHRETYGQAAIPADGRGASVGADLGREDRYRALFDSIPIGLYITSPDGRLLDANVELVRMLGHVDKSELLARSVCELYADPQDRQKELEARSADGDVRRCETRLRCRDGRPIWVLDTWRCVVARDGTLLRYEGSLLDITEAKRLEGELRHMARHDPLTGVLNRYALDEALSAEAARARRYKHPIGLLMVDIDRFKEFNDRYGHAAGDDILRRVAALLQRCVRETDVVVRYGGDEFLILLVETNGEVVRVKERILREIAAGFGDAYGFGPITVAVGAAHWSPETGESVDSLLSRADGAMYAEKHSGRPHD